MSVNLQFIGIIKCRFISLARHKTGLDRCEVNEDGQLIGTSSLWAECPKQTRLSQNGSRLFISTASEYGFFTDLVRIILMDTASWKELGRISVEALDFSVSPSGRYVCTFEKTCKCFPYSF